jgi:hypothetical protein
MPEIIHITEDEFYRLEVAYTSIRDPAIRAEFLRTIEVWVLDQNAAF